MNPASILSYYPDYATLDKLIQNKYNEINVFVDLKNCLQTLYMEHAILNIVESSLKTEYPDTSVFSSVISFLNFHNLYSIKRGIKINFYIFFESGQSYYHKNISQEYKVSRRIDDLYGLDKEKRELFFEVINKNFMLISKACNKLPRTKVFRLEHLEADFIPYYLIKHKLVNTGSNVVNVVYSNDHDLLQTIWAGENVYIFKKIFGSKSLVRKGEVMRSFLKVDCDLPDTYLPLAMAVVGDVGDDVYGIKGIGGKRIMSALNELVEIVGGIDNLYKNVHEGNPIFRTDQPKSANKYINTIIEVERKNRLVSDNLKLVSFEVLSRFLDYPVSTEMIKKRKEILEILENSRKKAPKEKIMRALEQVGVILEDEALDAIYFER